MTIEILVLGGFVHIIWLLRLALVALMLVCSCSDELQKEDDLGQTNIKEWGGSAGFKVPLPPGYAWMITQSWAEHCEECNEKGYDQIYGDYCNDSTHLLSCCDHGWDFNLPSNNDEGKSVLASGDGHIKSVGWENGWGNTVVIDHGDNICSRYAHMLDDSTDHLKKDQFACQGLKVGKIGNTGNSGGFHLHFQFEECDSKKTLAMGFTDGNGVPKCTIGNDVYGSNGQYTFLKLTNQERSSCDSDEEFSGAKLPEGDWIYSVCGTVDNCPLNPGCGRQAGHKFDDNYDLDAWTAEASAYLYQECAIDGKNDGELHPDDKITRAEALKIALYLFGMMDGCDDDVPFADVKKSDWFFGVIACAVDNGIIDSNKTYFNPNQEVLFVEGAKFLVEAADEAGVISVKSPGSSHFSKIDESHWGSPYVETIYAYGGLEKGGTNYAPERKLSRSEYIIMAASLSPCFCRNIECEDGCECSQEVFACVDPNDKSPGTGGGLVWPPDHAVDEDDEDSEAEPEVEEPEEKPEPKEDPEPREKPEETPEPTPTPEPEEKDPDPPEEGPPGLDPVDNSKDTVPSLTISCTADSAELSCPDETMEFEVSCSVSNNGQGKVQIDNLIMKFTTMFDCIITDTKLKNGGVGFQSIEAGEKKKLSGGFEIVCEYPPSEVDVVLDLMAKIDGEVKTFMNFQEVIISLPEGAGGSCKEPEPPPAICVPQCNGKQCGSDGCGSTCGDCNSGYNCEGGVCEKESVPVESTEGSTLTLSSEGGTMEIATFGWKTLYKSNPLPAGNQTVSFADQDLPAMILIHSGPKGFNIQLLEKSYGQLDFWIPFAGDITFNPPGNVSVKGYGANLPDPYISVLVRVPAKN